jgi:alkanesulfonate monooxygenase SsuD/methylene tetrahydromethanopterin reductase-like flavin-dependent oxidoreductase (luciferase family)
VDAGLFIMPCHPPERTPHEIIEWNLQVIRWADEYGYTEAWLGEHYTLGWEPLPAPDLMIAAALRETTRIKLCPGAHLPPYHHPISLAHRIAWLDHMAQGRYMLGVGAGAFVTDAQLFCTNGNNAEMLRESLEIMKLVWQADGPFTFEGKYWNVDYPEMHHISKGPHLKPFQLPYPPIAMAGLSPRSNTLKVAGENGFIPMSLNLSPHYLASHWEAYSEGAASAGREPDRSVWRVGREFLVAETDEEARRIALEGGLGRAYREYLIPYFKEFNFLSQVVPDPTVPESAITPEYLADNVWLVGSPDTVVEKIRQQYESAGGFGTLLGISWDYIDDPEPWRRSMELFATEVIPRITELEPRVASPTAGSGL